jgi:hypothetical protein
MEAGGSGVLTVISSEFWLTTLISEDRGAKYFLFLLLLPF